MHRATSIHDTRARRSGGGLRAFLITALSALALSVAIPASATIFERLPVRDQTQLERGEQVVRTQERAGSKWPAVTVYQLASVPPEAAAAIFTDFSEQSQYLRDCCGVMQSVVRDGAVGGNPRVQRVFYEISVPVFANERYELLETIAKGEGGTYFVSWKKIGEGGHSEAIVGRATFEPHGEGTLISYFNDVKINTFGAGVFAGKSVDRTKATVDAMVRHMQAEYAAGGQRLEREIARLRAAVGR